MIPRAALSSSELWGAGSSRSAWINTARGFARKRGSLFETDFEDHLDEIAPNERCVLCMPRSIRHAAVLVLFAAGCTTPAGERAAEPASSPSPVVIDSPPDAGLEPAAPLSVSGHTNPFGTVVACPTQPERSTPAWVLDRARQGMSAPVVDRLRGDLDGDGTDETIKVHAQPSSRSKGFGDIVVEIGSDAYWVRSGSYEGAQIIDLDPHDPERQVVIDGSFDGAVLGYRRDRITRLEGLSRTLPQRVKRSDERATFAVIGDEIVVLVEVGGETVRARFPAHSCNPTLGVIGLDLDPSHQRRDWLIEIGALTWSGPALQQFSSYLVVTQTPGGLEATGPFLAANSVQMTGPGQLEITHWDCGVRHQQIWTLAGGRLSRTSEQRTGKRDAGLCGRVQILGADLDGNGTDEMIAVRDGVIAVDGQQIRRDSLGAAQVTGQIVDIDTRDGQKELLVTHSLVEDARITLVYSYDGKVVKESPPIASRLDIDGDGDIRATVGACGEPIFEQTWALSGGRLRKLHEVERPATPPNQCAACPFVYIERAGRWSRVGEILRNLRRPQDQRWQSLAVPAIEIDGRLVRIRLAEEKPETTYLDAVHLLIDGAAVAPLACSEASPPPYCEEDDRFTVLQQGAAMTFEFELPPTSPASLELRALGYYLPHAATSATPSDPPNGS